MATQSCLILDWIGFRWHQKDRPWVALIEGFHHKFDYQRSFARGKLDLSNCDKKGRGARLAFYLPPGLYEVCEFDLNRKKYTLESRRYFVHSHDGETTVISKRKLNQWLEEKNRGWASMSSTHPVIG